VILREIVRAAAHRFGGRASFTPILRPNAVGNGVHVHFSLSEATTGRPVNHDPARPHGVSEPAGSFLAGIRARMPAMVAVTAPATISYLRLVPHRWSASYNNLGLRDREAGVRICPVFETIGVDVARQYHFEYRAADAAASPYLLLGMIVWAGLSGLRQGLPAPTPTERDPDAMDEAERAEAGVERLPRSLDEALDRFAADPDCQVWMGDDLYQAHLVHKRFEARTLGALSLEEQCERYRLAY
jgi:glutamine synthetase